MFRKTPCLFWAAGTADQYPTAIKHSFPFGIQTEQECSYASTPPHAFMARTGTSLPLPLNTNRLLPFFFVSVRFRRRFTIALMYVRIASYARACDPAVPTMAYKSRRST